MLIQTEMTKKGCKRVLALALAAALVFALLPALMPCVQAASDSSSGSAAAPVALDPPNKSAITELFYTAEKAAQIRYLDENGVLQLMDNVTPLTSASAGISAGWYVATGETTISERVVVTGNVHIILADGAHLTALLGITVSPGNSLTIYSQSMGDSMGRLTSLPSGSSHAGAGIGGAAGAVGAPGHAGTIIINGGLITARNGGLTANTAIGGAYGNVGYGGGDGGTIIINGGVVIATSSGGTAIGGGSCTTTAASPGASGSIAINGGTVVATGGGSGGNGIGGGYNNDVYGAQGAGTFTMNGNAVVTANRIGDTSAKTSGILFHPDESSTASFYGTSITPKNSFAVPVSCILSIPGNGVLSLNPDVTMTNGGTVTFADGSTVTVNSLTAVSPNKINGANAGDPTVSAFDDHTVTLNPSALNASTGQDLEYAKSEISTPPPDSEWQAGLTFGRLESNTDYYFFARAKENASFNSGAPSAGLLVTTEDDTTAPTVASVAPSGAGAVLSGSIVITFSEVMDTTAGTVQLNSLAALTGGTWSSHDTVFTVPYSGLANSTVYTVIISGFKDTAGNTMVEDGTHGFTTLPATSSTAPNPAPSPPPTPTTEPTTEPDAITGVLDLSGAGDATTAVLNAEAAQAFSSRDLAITVRLPNAVVTLAPETLAALAQAAEADAPERGNGAVPITIEVVVIPHSALHGMQAAQVKGYDTIVSLNVFVGDTKVNVPLTVSLPYELKPGEDPAAVRVWYMDENGNLTDLRGVYDEKTGMITFDIAHQSYYVVGYDPVALWVNVFGDLSPNALHYEAIAFMNQKGLMVGYGDGRIGAEDSISRAQFATLIWNLEGNPAPQGSASFADVPEGAWYYGAVIWAAENSVVVGIGGGLFDPGAPITREQAALMLYNYAVNFKEYDMPENRPMPDFSDYDRIDAWAETAAKALAEAGVIPADDEFRPKDEATRGEAADMFRNFARFIQ